MSFVNVKCLSPHKASAICLVRLSSPYLLDPNGIAGEDSRYHTRMANVTSEEMVRRYLAKDFGKKQRLLRISAESSLMSRHSKRLPRILVKEGR